MSDLAERLRDLFRERGWSIHMDDRPGQVIDPWELIAALDAQPVGPDAARLARALHETGVGDCAADGALVPFAGEHRVADHYWARSVLAALASEPKP